jgi:Ca2+-binding RTX toxin-like protein
MNIRRNRLVLVVIVTALTWLHASTASAINLTGTAAADNLFGTNGGDSISGLGGSDDIFGKAGNDRLSESGELWLGAGTDVGVGGQTTVIVIDDDGTPGDKLASNESADAMLSADGAKDIIRCGTGHDTVIADKTDSVATDCEIVLNESLTGLILGNNNDNIIPGSAGSEFIFGKRGNDTISGGDDVDKIFGGSGKDILKGELGNDTLVDDDGTKGDLLDGGPGADNFIAADGAKTKIDCGTGDAVADEIWADAIDVLLASCTGETTHIG